MDTDFLLETMLKYLHEGVLVVDRDVRVVFLNEPAGNITGIDHKSALGRSLFEIFPGLTKESSSLYKVLKSGKPLIDFIQTYINHKGRTVAKVTSAIPLYQGGVCIGAFEIYREIGQMKKLVERLNALEKELFYKANQSLERSNGTTFTLESIVGISEPIQSIKAQIGKIAQSNSAIMVYGETGTGKELVVQSIHNASRDRCQNPFIAQNCAAIPYTLLEGILFGSTAGSFTGAQDKPGLFELANGGTLFLDEINSMDIDLQAKLLRVLQDGLVRRIGEERSRKVNVRVIAAMNESPEKALEERKLREDLYYRLNVIPLYIPPLRERREDIPPLVAHFVRKYNAEMHMDIQGVTASCMRALKAFEWPGNIRQLQYTIERMMNFEEGDVLSEQYLPALKGMGTFESPQGIGEELPEDIAEAVERYERKIIVEALKRTNGNCSEASRLIRLPRQTLYNKVRKYQLKTFVRVD